MIPAIPRHDLDRTAGEALAQARVMCDAALHAAIDDLPKPLRHMAGYHFGWWDADGAPDRADAGKALRAALTLCTAASYVAGPAAAAPVAAAIELVHNFSLIHDDVIDGDEFRRGRKAVWAVWGTTDAVLLGDAMHALATGLLADALPAPRVCEGVRRVSDAVAEMCYGQHQDCHPQVALRRDSAESAVAAYERMALPKSGGLMGCACALGGLCGEADDADIAALNEFGRSVGLVLQLVDDLLGIWGDPQVTGKPADDIAHRKVTLPVILALTADSTAAAELAALYESDRPLSPFDIARATTLIESTGAQERAQLHADRWTHAAIAALPDRLCDSPLTALAYRVAHRNH